MVGRSLLTINQSLKLSGRLEGRLTHHLQALVSDSSVGFLRWLASGNGHATTASRSEGLTKRRDKKKIVNKVSSHPASLPEISSHLFIWLHPSIHLIYRCARAFYLLLSYRLSPSITTNHELYKDEHLNHIQRSLLATPGDSNK